MANNGVNELLLISRLEMFEHDYGLFPGAYTEFDDRLIQLVAAILESEPQRHKDKKRELKDKIAVVEEINNKLERQNYELRKQLAAATGTDAAEVMSEISNIIHRWTSKNSSKARNLEVEIPEEATVPPVAASAPTAKVSFMDSLLEGLPEEAKALFRESISVDAATPSASENGGDA